MNGTTTAFPNCTPLPLSDPDYDRLSKLVRESYPRACITMIDRITIPQAQKAYEEWLSNFSEKAQYTVFHGTKFANVASICQHSFQPSEGKVMAYGYGCYFAKYFAYSHTYTDSASTTTEDSKMSYVFVCSILPGRIAHGIPNKMPPSGFDSCANNPASPTIFAIPQACMMIPRFLIRFSKEAEQLFEPKEERMQHKMVEPVSVQQGELDLKKFSREERATIRKMQQIIKKSEKKSSGKR